MPVAPDELQRARALIASALCTLESEAETEALVEDLLTPRETLDLAQRLEVARLLRARTSYLGVSKVTGASSTTVSRVSKCLNAGAGGYALVLGRLDARDV